ncbi:LysR family transcriptional regulator [Leucobacter aridicollis]|uniref:LysR family transcriptional regulator n=1 Tax=Leucobacter aridicollis TaxID=283878 RepID=UPI002107829F|nr:LysR family transcriptional regulator [Leucobacter aridicollis]UTX54464.1 LysR family transcriptional regulator [Leucobacter aridicollis]
MELQQMRYVVAVAEERNFTRAAERCRVVQSALSHQVKALERELGVRLFARTSRRVELTAAGEAFLPHARASLESAERAIADAASAAGEVRGTLTIGLIPTVTALDAPAALAEFHRSHPAVQIALRGGGSNEFVAAIAAGRMDIAVLGLPDDSPPKGVAHRELVRERFVAVVGEQHPLAGRGRVSLADIAEETFVDFPVSTPGRAQSDLAFEAAGVRREVAFEVMDMGIIVELIRHGLVVALLAPALVADMAGIATVELTDGPGRVEYLAWSEFNPSPAALAFLRTVERGGRARG